VLQFEPAQRDDGEIGELGEDGRVRYPIDVSYTIRAGKKQRKHTTQFVVMG
jgi:hypothetical protein